MATEAIPESSLPRKTPPGFISRTFTASTGASLSVRIWPANPPVTEPAPFISYTHGGGWMVGNHFAPLAWLDPGFRQRGYHLISHNYRLSPQVSIEEQLADSLAAIAWCRASLPDILGKDAVDVDRYVICGDSAGGHLVSLMAHHLSPPPRVVINVYGIVDLASVYPIFGGLPAADANAPKWDGEFSDTELEAFLADRDPANVLTDSLFWDECLRLPESVVSQRWATEFSFTRRIRLQAELHRWRCDIPARPEQALRSLRGGLLHDERFADEEALKAFVNSVSPYLLLETKTWYPPTAFLHGMADEEAPLKQSQDMAARLKGMGVPVVECYEPEMLHVFDAKYTSADVPGWDTYIKPILEFCDEHVL